MTTAFPANQLRLSRARRAVTVAAYCSLATGFITFRLWANDAFSSFSWDARGRALYWTFLAIGWAPVVGGLLGMIALVIGFRTRNGRVSAAFPVVLAALYCLAAYSSFSHLPVH